MSSLIKYLTALRDGMRVLGDDAPPAGRHYFNLYDYVLDKGTEFHNAELTAEELTHVLQSTGPLGLADYRIKECFYNAQRLAHYNRDILYYEGYALTPRSPLPVLHAWNVYHGKVVDLTWRPHGSQIIGDLEGCQYLGVNVPRVDIAIRWLETELACSFLDDWENGWPMLKAPRETPIPPLSDHLLSAREAHLKAQNERRIQG